MAEAPAVGLGPIRWRREAIAFFVLGLVLIALLTGDKDLIQTMVNFALPVITFYFGMRARGD